MRALRPLAASPGPHLKRRWQGALIYLELLLKIVLERGSTIAHQCLSEFLHFSLRLTDVAQRVRGRGDYSEVCVLGNGLGRLMEKLRIGEFWAPSVLFPPRAREGLRRRDGGGASGGGAS